RRHALRQDPQLLLEAPASAAFRAGENLAPHLPSSHMSTPEILVINQRAVVHRTTAQTKGGRISLTTPSARRRSADTSVLSPFRIRLEPKIPRLACNDDQTARPGAVPHQLGIVAAPW